MSNKLSPKTTAVHETPSELIREAEAIKFAVEAANVGYWVWDLQTDEVFLSDVTLNMLQLTRAEVGNDVENIKKLIHHEDYIPLKTSLRDYIENDTFFEIDFRVRRKDSSFVWINIDGRSRRDDEGKPSKVGGSTVDATGYVDLKRQLEQEKQNLRLIFDNVPARIWLKDSHNKILRLNEKAAESMNLAVKDAEGADTYDLFPEMAKAYHDADLAVINSGRPLEGIVEKFAPADGLHGWVNTDKLPFRDPITDESYVLVISTDITQQKEFENRIIENTVRLNQANKDLDHFAYMASHDLRAPLRGMDQIAQWIGEDLGENATQDVKDNIKMLRGRVNRMDTLLTDILAFSRAGKNMAEPEDINVGDIVDEVTGWLSPLGNFKIVKDTDLPTLHVPRSALEHIFLNLLSNAIKHHDQDSGTVKIGYGENEDCHVFYVSDDGPGVPEKYQNYIFEVFKKLKPRDDIEGSGIGLSIVKKMAEALGGSIEIIAEDGKRGTTFNIILPK